MRRIISALKGGNRVRLLGPSVLTVAALFGTTGCYEKLNGDGWMQLAEEEGRATFGIHYERFAAQGTYQDKAAEVRLRFYEAVPKSGDLEEH